MTKVRTIIPTNAKPGRSIIQVTNPHTGVATRVRVPPHVLPGQVIELDLNNEASMTHISQGPTPSLIGQPYIDSPTDTGLKQSIRPEPVHTSPFGPKPESVIRDEPDRASVVSQTVARVPTPTSLPMPTEFSQPHSYYIGDDAQEDAHLLDGNSKGVSNESGWFYTCVRFFHCPC